MIMTTAVEKNSRGKGGEELETECSLFFHRFLLQGELKKRGGESVADKRSGETFFFF